MAHIQCICPALKHNRMAVHNHIWKAITDIFRTLLPPPDFTIVMEASSSATEAALNAITGGKYQQQRDEITRCLSHIQNADWEDPHPLPPASPTNPHNWNSPVHEPPLLLATGRPTQRQRTTDSFEPPGEHQPTLLRHPDTTQTRAPEPRRPTTAYSKQRPDSLLLDWRNRKLHILEFTRPYDSKPQTLHDTDIYKRNKYEPLRQQLQRHLPSTWTCSITTFTLGVRGTAFTTTWIEALRAINIPDPHHHEHIIQTAIHASLIGLDTILQARAAQRRRDVGDAES